MFDIDYNEILEHLDNISFMMSKKYDDETGESVFYSQGVKLSKNEYDAKREAVKDAIVKKEDVYNIGIDKDEVDKILKNDFPSFFAKSDLKEILGE